VLRAQLGSREALDRVLRSVQAPLFRYLRALVGDHALAEDVLQDVMLLICRKLRWLREPALFDAWAFRIATREAFHRLRRERRWAGRLDDDAALEALPAPAAEETDRFDVAPERLAELVQALAPASRAVVTLHYGEGLTIHEAADVLGIPPGTAKSRLAYGLAALRARLADTGARATSAEHDTTDHATGARGRAEGGDHGDDRET
jgi:RNA polymerase sigma-70 factor (ECF subfamily)